MINKILNTQIPLNRLFAKHWQFLHWRHQIFRRNLTSGLSNRVKQLFAQRFGNLAQFCRWIEPVSSLYIVVPPNLVTHRKLEDRQWFIHALKWSFTLLPLTLLYSLLSHISSLINFLSLSLSRLPHTVSPSIFVPLFLSSCLSFLFFSSLLFPLSFFHSDFSPFTLAFSLLCTFFLFYPYSPPNHHPLFDLLSFSLERLDWIPRIIWLWQIDPESRVLLINWLYIPFFPLLYLLRYKISRLRIYKRSLCYIFCSVLIKSKTKTGQHIIEWFLVSGIKVVVYKILIHLLWWR